MTRTRHELALGDPNLYVEVDDQGREAGTREWWHGAPASVVGTSARRVHVMSRAAGGEVRSYWQDERDRLWLAAPCYTGEWRELDAEVARAVGASVVPYRAVAGGVCHLEPEQGLLFGGAA